MSMETQTKDRFHVLQSKEAEPHSPKTAFSGYKRSKKFWEHRRYDADLVKDFSHRRMTFSHCGCLTPHVWGWLSTDLPRYKMTSCVLLKFGHASVMGSETTDRVQSQTRQQRLRVRIALQLDDQLENTRETQVQLYCDSKLPFPIYMRYCMDPYPLHNKTFDK